MIQCHLSVLGITSKCQMPSNTIGERSSIEQTPEL